VLLLEVAVVEHMFINMDFPPDQHHMDINLQCLKEPFTSAIQFQWFSFKEKKTNKATMSLSSVYGNQTKI